MSGFLTNGLLTLLLAQIAGTLETLWELLARLVLVTPDVTVLPQVRSLAGNSLTVVNVCFVLAVTATGIVVLTQGEIPSRYGPGELLPRLVVGFVAANFALPICHYLIVVGNALTLALVGRPLDTHATFQQLLRTVRGSLTNPSQPLLVISLGVLVAVLTGMLLISLITRTALLVVLTGIAPLALACHASPFTDPVAKLWWRSVFGLLATVLLQAFVLHAAVVVFLDPAANLPAVGLFTDSTSIFNLFMVACLLWATVKIPGLMRRYVLSTGGGRNPAGTLLRMLVVQRLTGGLTARLRGPARLAARSGAGSTGGRVLPPPVSSVVIPYWRPRSPRPAPATSKPDGSTGSPRPRAAQPASLGSGPGGVASLRPRVPAGVNPATVMPRTRPSWQRRAAMPSPRPGVARPGPSVGGPGAGRS